MRFVGGAALVLGDFPSSSAHLADAAAAYRAEGRLGLLSRSLGTRAWGQLFIGDSDEVLADLDGASGGGGDGEQVWAITATAGEAMLAALRGDSESAERMAGEVQAIPLLTGVRFIRRGTTHPRRRGAVRGPSRRGIRSPDPDVRSERRHIRPEHVDMALPISPTPPSPLGAWMRRARCWTASSGGRPSRPPRCSRLAFATHVPSSLRTTRPSGIWTRHSRPTCPHGREPLPLAPRPRHLAPAAAAQCRRPPSPPRGARSLRRGRRGPMAQRAREELRAAASPAVAPPPTRATA